MMTEDQFRTELAKHGIQLSENQLEQFVIYYENLFEWNKKMNLTAITEKGEVYLKHFFDSLTPAFFVDFTRETIRLCDVGAGAGFPGIPLKIAFPHIKLTIVDSLKKRIGFLQELIKQLGLDGIELYHDRAETFGRRDGHRDSYDIVTARAVATLPVLCEYCLPLVKPGGLFIALKGASGKEELEQSQKAIQLLGGHLQSLHSFTLPLENSERTIIGIEKEKRTPKKYPRKPGVPAKEPLI